jgi:hypothetical protein
MRVPFDTVFHDNGNGSYSPRSVIRIGGITMSPGVSFTSGVSFSNFNIAEYAGRDLEIIQHADGSVELKGAY